MVKPMIVAFGGDPPPVIECGVRQPHSVGFVVCGVSLFMSGFSTALVLSAIEREGSAVQDVYRSMPCAVCMRMLLLAAVTALPEWARVRSRFAVTHSAVTADRTSVDDGRC